MTVATVRLLAADPETYDRVAAVGDGATVEFRVPNAPVVAGSVHVFVAAAEQAEGSDFTFDYPIGLATLAAAPAVGAQVVIPYRYTILSDADLADLLALEGGNVRLAAAQALDVIASSEALIQKKIRLLGGDLETDGPAVAKSLREHAQRLRDQVTSGLGSGEATFDVVEMVVDDFSARERVVAEALRSA